MYLLFVLTYMCKQGDNQTATAYKYAKSGDFVKSCFFLCLRSSIATLSQTFEISYQPAIERMFKLKIKFSG